MLGRTWARVRAGRRALAALPLAFALAVAALPQARGQTAEELQQQQAATPFRPVAVVNGSAITGFDLIQRARIMLAGGYQPQSEEELRQAALDRLIEDRLKLQEAERLNLTATNEEIEAGIAELAKNVGMEPDEMLSLLAAQGVSRDTVEQLVAADVLWRKVVGTRFAGQLEPDQGQIDAEMATLADRTRIAYRLGEIALPMETEERSAAETRALAEDLSQRLATGADFPSAARRFSRAPSAAQGGDLGWVTSDSLPAEVAEALFELEPGDVTRPIPVEGGVTILKVLDRREQPFVEFDPDDPAVRESVRARLTGRRMQRLADGLMQELRRDALIEIR